MTQIQYPPNLINVMKSSRTPVLTMEIAAPPIPGYCPNCGGIGHLYVFVAERGPMQDPPGATKGDIISRSVEDPMYGWVWYTGRDVGGICPVCNGLGKVARQGSARLYPTAKPMKTLTEGFEK